MRSNVKLLRLELRVIDAQAHLKGAAMETAEYRRWNKKLRQRSRYLGKARANGDRNKDVNEARNRAEGTKRAAA